MVGVSRTLTWSSGRSGIRRCRGDDGKVWPAFGGIDRVGVRHLGQLVGLIFGWKPIRSPSLSIRVCCGDVAASMDTSSVHGEGGASLNVDIQIHLDRQDTFTTMFGSVTVFVGRLMTV